jgi:hypothetical protein
MDFQIAKYLPHNFASFTALSLIFHFRVFIRGASRFGLRQFILRNLGETGTRRRFSPRAPARAHRLTVALSRPLPNGPTGPSCLSPVAP